MKNSILKTFGNAPLYVYLPEIDVGKNIILTGGKAMAIIMNSEPLKIKRRGEDGNKIITVRIKEDILVALDNLAAESNYSRNELINIILRHGVENIIIE